MSESNLNYNNSFEENSIHNLSINIFYTNNWLLEKYKNILNKFGLRYNQYYILGMIAKSHPKPIPMYSIYHSVIDKSINLSRVIDSLYNLNLVCRNQSIEDRRVVDVLITQKGLELLDELNAIIKKFDNFQNENDYQVAINLNSLLTNFRESQKSPFNYK